MSDELAELELRDCDIACQFSESTPMQRITSSDENSARGAHRYRRFNDNSSIFAISESSANVLARPGELVTDDALLRHEAVQDLYRLIQLFAHEGLAITDCQNITITNQTAKAAVALFKAIPFNFQLPKIAPEGEGGLTVLWRKDNEQIILVIEDWKLNLITGATTAKAEYYDNLSFDGETVPQVLLEAIPEY